MSILNSEKWTIAGNILLGLLLLVTFYLSASYVAWEVSGLSGTAVQDQLQPYTHAHLLGEASEGIYSPLSSEVFVMGALFVNILAFGFSIFCLRVAIGKKNCSEVCSAVTLCGIVGLIWVRRYIFFESGYPWAMRSGFIFEILIAFGAAYLGLRLGRYVRERRASEVK